VAPSKMAPSRTVEWLWVMSAFVLLTLGYATTQPVHPGEGAGEDGQAYHAMAKAMPSELPPNAVAPFAYRVGMPLAAAGLAKGLDWVISAGFDRLNLAFNALSVILLTVLLQRHVSSVFARMVVILAFMIEPHSPVRLSFIHPLSTDAAVLAGLLVGLLGIEWFQGRPTPSRAWVLAAFVAAGVVVHEVLLITGLCVLFCHLPGDEPRATSWPAALAARLRALDRTGAWLPLISGLAVLAALHAWVVPTPSVYSFSGELARWFGEKSLTRLGLAVLLVFGPALVLPILNWRDSLLFLRQRPVFAAHLMICGLWAWLGTGQTERGLALASPVVYLLVGPPLVNLVANPTTFAATALVVLQSLSSRVFSAIGPIEPPVARSEVWERLGWADVSWALSYSNLWSESAAASMVSVYWTWYITTGAVIAFLWSRTASSPSPTQRVRALASGWLTAVRRLRRPRVAVTVVLMTAAVMTPVVWLAVSRFFWTNYAQPGPGYLGYNVARLWLIAAMLMAFVATGSRIVERGALPATTPRPWRQHFIESAFAGAAAWSVSVVLVAALHMYYVWLVLPAVTLAVAVAVFDWAASPSAGSTLLAEPEPDRWGLAGVVLRLGVTFSAVVILVAIALWGHFGGDNDVPGNYLPYYEQVLDRHSIAPNDYWVHYFASKGNGLGFLANVLSDVNGAALATYLMLLLGAGMIWRLTTPTTRVAPLIGLVGVCLYLQYYGGQGAYAKSHLIRNTFILYLVLSTVRAACFTEAATGVRTLPRLVVIAAVIVLSPLAAVLLLPVLLAATAVLMMSGHFSAARRSLLEPLWAVAVTAVVCAYNFLQVGIPELHNMPSFVARFVSLDQLRQWMDPDLAYVDYRLGFLRVLLQGSPSSSSVVTITPVQSLADALSGVLNLPVIVLVAGATLSSLFAWACSRRPAPDMVSIKGPLLGVAYLLSVLALISGLRLFGGGPGSSMGRFTDFANPLGIAIGVVILSTARTLEISGLARRFFMVLVIATAVVPLYLGSASLWALPWRASAGFAIGLSSYAHINEGYWDTATAHRVAESLPPRALVEMVNFLPGFTAIPATPFQRPDGCVYLKDYTAVIYGSPEQAATIYATSKIGYFLFDVSPNAPVAWSGFSPLFTPDSIRSRMQLVRRYTSVSRDLYLLTWRQGDASNHDEAFDVFLDKWAGKLTTERQGGYFHGSYVEAARRIGLRQ